MIEYNSKSVFNFFKSPNILQGEFKSTSYKNKRFIKLFFINLFIVALISIITGFLRIYFNISFKGANLQLPMIWLLNFSMIPILEEVAYRLPLIYNKKYLVLSFTTITYFIVTILYGKTILDISTNIYPQIIIAILVGSMIYFALSIKKVENKISAFWSKHFKSIFYSFLFLFAIGHLNGYNFSIPVLILFPILLLPQFIGGIFSSFVRIKFGFIYALIFHIMINIVAFSPQIFMNLLH